MTVRHVFRAAAATLLACGLVALASSSARAQQSPDLPKQGGPITLWGCFVEQKIDGNGKYQLVNPTFGTATSVPEGACAWNGTDTVIELEDVHENVHKHHLDRSMIGRWIEVTGRLENRDKTGLREVHVRSFRVVPVVPPKVAEAEPPAPFVPAMPEVAPPVPTSDLPAIGTTGVAELPKTASSLPMTALFAALALAVGVAVLALRRIA